MYVYTCKYMRVHTDRWLYTYEDKPIRMHPMTHGLQQLRFDMRIYVVVVSPRAQGNSGTAGAWRQATLVQHRIGA